MLQAGSTSVIFQQVEDSERIKGIISHFPLILFHNKGFELPVQWQEQVETRNG